MGVLREHGSGREVELLDRSTVGRSRACDVVLAGREVSGQHAEFRWTGSQWELHDLGSRNGSWVDDIRLEPGGRTLLLAGTRLRFGHASSVWELVDASGPQPVAYNLATGVRCVADGGYLAFPDADNPEFCVYQESDGAWIVERDGASVPVEDRAVLSTRDGGSWRLHLPRSCASTWRDDAAPVLVADLRLRFSFSRDEEHVELLAFHGARRFDLQARSHHYLSLLLARRRLADEGAGRPEPDQGWIRLNELAGMLRLDEKHINIIIHRARSQLGKLGVVDAAALIERRPGTGQLRLGCSRIELVPLEASGGRS